MVLNDEEFNAIVTSAKYEFYKDYVEPLESDYDDLAFELESLKEENLKLKKQIEDSTYRKIAKNLKFKLNERDSLIKRMKIEIAKLKKENDVYKTKKLKGEF